VEADSGLYTWAADPRCCRPQWQADPRFHTPLFHVGKVHLVSKLQPDPASSPGEKVGGHVVVKVDPRLLRSRIQDLQQNVATI